MLSLIDDIPVKVFVSGASGLIGSAAVRELISAGHQVVGLARSNKSAALVASMGAEVLRGDLEDLDSLRRGAADSDGVIHTAFMHDRTNFAKGAEVDRAAIETIGAVLAGSDRPFVVSAGTPGLVAGHVVTEDEKILDSPIPRFSENAALLLTSQQVRVSVMRLPRYPVSYLHWSNALYWTRFSLVYMASSPENRSVRSNPTRRRSDARLLLAVQLSARLACGAFWHS